MKTHQENGNGYQQEINGNVIIMEDKKQTNLPPTGTNGSVTDGSQFITRVASIPLVQDSLSITQSMANRFKLGRFFLHQTHSIVDRLAYIMQKTQETQSYQHYFRQDGYLQKTLYRVDGWACSSLDIAETKVPLIQQSTTTIIDTLIVQPQLQIKSRINSARDTLINRPLLTMNDKINKDLDRLELWMKDKDLVVSTKKDGNNTIHHRLVLLSGSVVSKAIGSGINQANQVKQQGLEWMNYQINDKPLLSQKIVPLMKSIKSHLDASLSQLNQWMHMTIKTTTTTTTTTESTL